jgi:opacity protein-like surface antigen
MSRFPLRLLCALLLLLAGSAPARADITVFLGGSRVNTAPANPESDKSTRLDKGFAVGLSLVIIGFEFEWATMAGDELQENTCVTASDFRALCVPSLTTGMGNVLLQTPHGLAPFQVYGTVGAGFYKERYSPFDESDYGGGTNVGGGVKIDLVGPLRVRLDYRLFKLANDAFHDTSQRFYAGANLAF